MTTIRLPRDLTAVSSLRFAAQLAESVDSPHYVIDASQLEYVEPFGMLFCSAALRHFRQHRTSAVRKLQGVDCAPDYAAHMGFWQSFGAKVGRPINASKSTATYIPITCANISELNDRARNSFKPIHAAIDDVAGEMADLLVQDDCSDVNRVIHYCMRELIRNVIEHSGATEFWYCAQYWPSKDIVELALLDEGRGFQASLAENPKLQITDETQAIKSAVKKGVSRTFANNAGSFGWSNTLECINAGIGLFALSKLASFDGSLLVASNCDAVRFEPRGTDVYSSYFKGSAIRLNLRPSSLPSALPSLMAELATDTGPSSVFPSKSLR